MFDPLGITGIPTAHWSPLAPPRHPARRRQPRAILARTGGDDGRPGDRFWRGQAEQLIAAMLWTAANTDGHTMRNVVKLGPRPRPARRRAAAGTLAPARPAPHRPPRPAVALAAKQVQGWLHGQWNTDPRTTSSVYATARNAVWPWADPAIADQRRRAATSPSTGSSPATTRSTSCAPLGDETRIGVVFAVVLHDLITQAFTRYNRAGEPSTRRLLVLLDEAANTPLPKLPAMGIHRHRRRHPTRHRLAVQSAQLDSTYRHDADTVLTNHRTKLIYPSGLTDAAPPTTSATSPARNTSAATSRHGNSRSPRTTATEPVATAVPYVSAHVLRRLQTGAALLFDGQLPAA